MHTTMAHTCPSRPACFVARPLKPGKHRLPKSRMVLVRAGPDADEEEFERRLADMRSSASLKAKSKENRSDAQRKSSKNREKKVKVNYDDEQLWRELTPARADLIFNIAMGATLIWLPLTAAAVSRCAFVKYRVTDKRIVVITDAPWKKEESQIGFHEVASVVGVNRGLGAWGDMVVRLTEGDKLELRSVPDWQEVRDYIMERRDAIRGKDLTAEELMNG